jgi:hypothetical protein
MMEVMLLGLLGRIGIILSRCCWHDAEFFCAESLLSGERLFSMDGRLDTKQLEILLGLSQGDKPTRLLLCDCDFCVLFLRRRSESFERNLNRRRSEGATRSRKRILLLECFRIHRRHRKDPKFERLCHHNLPYCNTSTFFSSLLALQSLSL